jgi:hypothetical protein
MTAGYSGTPLGRKLSFKPGMRVYGARVPDSVRREVDGAGLELTWLRQPRPGLEAAHVFVTRRSELARHLKRLRGLLDPAGMVWVSWPKKASGVSTDITEDEVRRAALPLGFVDVKVCAVDAVWSGLKLVVRKTLRERSDP